MAEGLFSALVCRPKYLGIFAWNMDEMTGSSLSEELFSWECGFGKLFKLKLMTWKVGKSGQIVNYAKKTRVKWTKMKMRQLCSNDVQILSVWQILSSKETVECQTSYQFDGWGGWRCFGKCIFCRKFSSCGIHISSQWEVFKIPVRSN